MPSEDSDQTVNVQADLNLYLVHMSKDTSSDVATHLSEAAQMVAKQIINHIQYAVCIAQFKTSYS